MNNSQSSAVTATFNISGSISQTSNSLLFHSSVLNLGVQTAANFFILIGQS